MLEVGGDKYDSFSSSSSSSSSAAAAQCFSSCVNPALISKKNKYKNKRRFNDDQIRSLETMFQSESKLEPPIKLQLAKDLGLHPRQVAIWFQNKRARWKSKQLERDYTILRDNYNTLASQFETLNKEKQSLLTQLQKLKDLIEKSENKEAQCCKEDQEVSAGSSSGRVSDCNRGLVMKISESDHLKPGLSLEYGVGVLSDDDSGIKTGYLGLEDDDPELLNMVEPADSCLTSPEQWGSLESDGLLDQPTSSYHYQWWDFWS